MVPPTPKAATHDGQPALEYEGQEGWGFYVTYFMRQGEPALGFTVSLGQCPGHVYVTRTRVSGDFRNSTCENFDLPRSSVTAQKQPGKVVLSAGSSTYELVPEGERGNERHAARVVGPGGEFLIRAINNFGPVFANVRRLATEAQGQGQTAQQPGASTKPAPAQREAPGILTLTSDPGDVQVYVNDEPKGMTSTEGREVLRLPAGTYRVRLSLPGYKDFEQQVTLTSGKNQDLTAKMEPVGPPPFTANDVAEMLEGKMSAKRVASLIQERGVDFELNPDLEKRLRGLGATSDLLLAIATNNKK